MPDVPAVEEEDVLERNGRAGTSVCSISTQTAILGPFTSCLEGKGSKVLHRILLTPNEHHLCHDPGASPEESGPHL